MSETFLTARRALLAAALIELPLLVLFLIVGVPTTPRPSAFAVLLAITQFPGAVLVDARMAHHAAAALGTPGRPAFADAVALGAVNTLLLAFVLYVGYRLWRAGNHALSNRHGRTARACPAAGVRA